MGSPCGCFRATGASVRRYGSSGPSLRGSIRGADARSQLKCCRAGWPRTGQRREPDAPFPYTVRTSDLPWDKRFGEQPLARIIRHSFDLTNCSLGLSVRIQKGSSVGMRLWTEAARRAPVPGKAPEAVRPPANRRRANGDYEDVDGIERRAMPYFAR